MSATVSKDVGEALAALVGFNRSASHGGAQLDREVPSGPVGTTGHGMNERFEGRSDVSPAA